MGRGLLNDKSKAWIEGCIYSKDFFKKARFKKLMIIGRKDPVLEYNTLINQTYDSNVEIVEMLLTVLKKLMSENQARNLVIEFALPNLLEIFPPLVVICLFAAKNFSFVSIKSSLEGNSSISISLPFLIILNEIASSADIPQF